MNINFILLQDLEMADSVILTKLPKGQIHATAIKPKGEVENLKFAKGPLEELSAEYDFSKPNFTLYRTEGPSHQRIFFVKCVVEDTKRGNLFIAISKGEPRIRLAEHSAARKILKQLEKVYFFSEETNVNKEFEETYVIFLDNESKLLIKLYKWENCCEYFYLRGHTMNECNKRIKRNKRLNEQKNIAEEEFWGPLDHSENDNLIYLTP